MKPQTENLSHAIRLFSSWKTPLLLWTAAAQRTLPQLTMALCIGSPSPSKTNPPSTTVRQLHPWGALLASTPTHCTPWCQNTEHSSSVFSHKQHIAEPTDKSCQKSHSSAASTCLRTNRHAQSIKKPLRCLKLHFLVNMFWSYWCRKHFDIWQSATMKGYQGPHALFKTAVAVIKINLGCCLA